MRVHVAEPFFRRRYARLACLSVLKTVMDPEGPWEFDPLCLRQFSSYRSSAVERSTDNRVVAGANPAGRPISPFEFIEPAG